MKKKNLITVLIAILIVIAGVFYIKNYKQKINNTANQASPTVDAMKVKQRKYNNIVATFFFHGAGSSYRAEEHMANAAVKAGAADQIICANVPKNDHVSLIGKFTKAVKHPIIEVNYANNMAVNPNDVKVVLTAVQNKYGFHKVNLVGHSMGNLLIANYINENYANRKLPQIQKVVSIAGHYNGWLGEEKAAASPTKNRKTGEPVKRSASFRQLLGLRKHYPRNIRVLNMYGDLQDGSKSDVAVAVSSARSYKYLINGRARSYREVEFLGRSAQHSRLHSNTQVDRELINFLWNR